MPAGGLSYTTAVYGLTEYCFRLSPNVRYFLSGDNTVGCANKAIYSVFFLVIHSLRCKHCTYKCTSAMVRRRCNVMMPGGI